nr:unnamed protein product [Spirometra erinaceieuropaei]
MGLFGHMRIHESGTDRTPNTPTTSTVHTPTPAPSVRAATTTTTTTTTGSSVTDTDTADFSCPHCPRTFTSRIGLVGHLRIHRTETGEPVPGAPTFTHHARLNCPHPLAPSGIAWAYSATCASTTTCGGFLKRHCGVVLKVSTFAFTSASVFYLYGAHLPQKPGDPNYIVRSQTDASPAENPIVSLFEKFASVEFDGEAFMTPRDFIDCVTGARPPDETMANKILANTPAISSCRVSLFKRLDRNGLISCSEFLFLLSVLTGSPLHSFYTVGSLHKLQVLFLMFDRDGSGRIEKTEFLQMTNLCQLKFHKEASICETTTLLRYFFNKDGSGRLAYKDFTKFMANLQKEILSAEFNRLSMGTDAISRLEMAEAILRYAKTSPAVKEMGYKKVAESIAFESDSITFESYCDFFTLLYDYEDFSAALKMFLQARRTISKDEFQRAARAVTGKFLDKAIVDTVFLLFDADGDGHLSPEEFISFIRSYIARGTRDELTSESTAQSFTSCVATRVRAN